MEHNDQEKGWKPIGANGRMDALDQMRRAAMWRDETATRRPTGSVGNGDVEDWDRRNEPGEAHRHAWASTSFGLGHGRHPLQRTARKNPATWHAGGELRCPRVAHRDAPAPDRALPVRSLLPPVSGKGSGLPLPSDSRNAMTDVLTPQDGWVLNNVPPSSP
jgi:hypothetical protein